MWIQKKYRSGVITIIPMTTLQDVEPSRAVVAGGVTMRALLEKETTDPTEVNIAALEMKLAEQVTEMKDPRFSLEIVATMAAILLGASSTQSGP